MRLKNYGRNHKKRKEYIKQSGLLLVGVDVSKAKHDACIGSLEGVRCRIGFRNARDGFKRFEDAIRKNMFRNKCKHVLIAMEPSGLYWYALYNRLKSCGYGVCLVKTAGQLRTTAGQCRMGKARQIKKMHTVSLIFCNKVSFFCRLNVMMNLTVHSGTPLRN